MIENRDSISATFEAFDNEADESAWLERDLSPEPVEICGKRILLVDDERPLRVCLRMVLELQGHQVTEANNGAEALNLFTRGEFDLVITDLEMPVMEGSELAASIKLLAPSLPILMITGSLRARRGADSPVDVLLDKPFTVAHLHRALGQLFSSRAEAIQSQELALGQFEKPVEPVLEVSRVGVADAEHACGSRIGA